MKNTYTSRLKTSPKQLGVSTVKIADNNSRFNHPNGNLLMHSKGIISKGTYYTTPKATNTLIYGIHNSGTYQMLVKPTINNNSRAEHKYQKSMIINDPTGKIYKDMSKKLSKHGYSIYTLNLRDFPHFESTAIKYNPLTTTIKHIYHYDMDSARNSCLEVGNIIFNTNSRFQGKDKFYYIEASNIFTYIVLDMINNYKNQTHELEDTNKRITLPYITNHIESMTENDFKKYPEMFIAGEEDAGSIASVLKNVLKAYIYNLNLKETISDNTFNLTKALYNKKNPSAIFLETSPNFTRANRIASIFIRQAFNIAINQKLRNHKELPHSLQFILSPCSNLSALLNLDRMLSINESTNMTFLLSFQNEEQIEHIYGSDAPSIIANCPMLYYVLSHSDETMKSISNALGKEHIVKTYPTKDKNGKPIIKTKKYTKKIMPMNHLKHLKRGEVIIIPTNDRMKLDGTDTFPTPIFTTGNYVMPYK